MYLLTVPKLLLALSTKDFVLAQLLSGIHCLKIVERLNLFKSRLKAKLFSLVYRQHLI